MRGTIRKIIVGDNYTHNIKYIKGIEYRIGRNKCILTDFISHGEHPNVAPIDIYVNDGKSSFIWKTIKREPLEIEYDVNFS